MEKFQFEEYIVISWFPEDGDYGWETFPTKEKAESTVADLIADGYRATLYKKVQTE